jgi:AhpD family alkylhydroperoxidase
MEEIDYRRVHPELFDAMHTFQAAVDGASVDRRLVELCRLRASQINGCSFCVGLHSSAARAEGESEERLQMVAVWRTAKGFSPRERAALRWFETLTRIADGPVDDARVELAQHFNDEEIVSLTWASAAINAWNRVAVSLGHHGGPAVQEES